MKRTLIAIAVAVVLAAAGCNQQPTLEQQKAEAKGRWSQARAQVVAAVGMEHLKTGDLDQAQSSALEALAMDAKYVPAQCLLAKVLIEKGLYNEAIAQLRTTQAQAPRSAEVAYLLGVALEKRGEFAEAIERYNQARQLDPGNDFYVTAAAEVLVSMGKPGQALELLEGRLSNSDGTTSMVGLAAELAMLVGEPRKAAVLYQRCLDASPANASAREGLAKAYFFAGDYDKALDLLKRLAAEPDYRDKAGWIYVMSGDAHLALGQAREAKTAYEIATMIDPEDARVWVGLSKVSLALDELPGATKAARRALKLDPRCTEAAALAGYVLLRQGEPKEAIEVLKTVRDNEPQNPALWCTLGRCYQQLGDKDKAAGCFLEALRADPDNRLAKALLAAGRATQ